ncbi:MAG: glycosyltransferase, partial [Nonlabens sp.]|nr:glycosyltransferase [Nonlabens sp.]
IIVPNYNHASFLRERIDSILNQSYQDFEIILLDDCSTDASVELLNKYKDHPKVSQLVINKENSGSPFKQWQKGIELAQGTYIWIAESDDYCEPTFLETLIPLLEDREVVLAYCASNIIDQLGTLKGRHKWADALSPTRWENNFKNDGIQETKSYLRYRNTITNASAVLFRKDAVRHNTFPTSMKFCGDWVFWIEILKQGKLVYVKEPLNYFRRHASTTKHVKSFSLEQLRFNEYAQIIKSQSSLWHRIFNYNKYYWIIQEWNSKKENFPKNAHNNVAFPTEFLWYFNLKKYFS